jgi:hypothetical protein
MDVKLSKEHIKFLWIPIEEALRILEKENDKDLIKKIQQTIDHKHNSENIECL